MNTELQNRVSQIQQKQTQFAKYGKYADAYLKNMFENLELHAGYAIDPLTTYIHFKLIDVNGFKDEEGNTMLHHVAKCGLPKIVADLLGMGADPTLLNNNGQKPADVVCTKVNVINVRGSMDKFVHSRYDQKRVKNDYEFTDELISCQDPTFPLYIEIIELLQAAEAMRMSF